ncbi:amino acid/amide ABC transporter substrate-binding protein (HAAT family) [Humitalea rosea]|uniref:Amino acid/amide ABC transporter substrate-binding protein (HAAT family) n=1 Tax=Humitalea rosea TaxID=990373 RepID=A0A2W7IEB5_9PROT|nr:ABC transporter substrate-binding protein [Humitalea rosea]PZW44799.1 amino acid/amide ABC transporter substrate-binding protein (HAAT family) [Humitalea rosea]
MSLRRRSILTGTAGALAAAAIARPSFAADSVMVGVSGPLTGPNAQYGAQWKDAFELALEEVNPSAAHKVQYQFEDSQADPRQTVAIAQKFVNDSRIIMELGDFSSTASMAASPIYQRAKLVQFGFTNSHPDFTKGGDYMWSNSISQAEEQPSLADYAITDLGRRRLGVIHLNTDWGVTSKNLFVSAVQSKGATVTLAEGFLPNERDFRSTLVRIRDSNPDGIVIIAYYADAATIIRQIRTLGLTQTIIAVSSVYSPKLIELGGDAVNGVHTLSNFFPGEPRAEVQRFVTAFQAKYAREPDNFNATAYDTMVLVSKLVNTYGTTRAAIREGLPQVESPSVIYGTIKFDPATRRVSGAQYKKLVVKDGAFAMFQGGTPA